MPSPAAEPRLPEDLADLEDATLDDLADEALVDGVTVSGGVGTDVRVRALTLTHARLAGVRLPGATFEDAEMVDVVWDDCDLAGLTLASTVLRRVTFRRCRLTSLVAADLVASDVWFLECRMEEAWLRAARVERADLSACDLTGSDWYGARVTKTRIRDSRLDGAELSQSRLDGVALHGTSIDGVRGSAALRKLVIGPEQVLDVALAVFPSLGIRVEEPDDT
jgi:uncharacterized protein YjbI with pentapeptide repeats